MHKIMFPSKLQICFKGYILRIPSVFHYRGNVLPAYPLNHFAYPWGYTYPSLGTEGLELPKLNTNVKKNCASKSKVYFLFITYQSRYTISDFSRTYRHMSYVDTNLACEGTLIARTM